MELRAFAEQVLFATTLEEKLRAPASCTDERPGAALDALPAPGRPAELRFKPSGAGKADAPGLHRLDDERERGRLLHFFANHELLATELMALVLLRFPEAPAAFRQGVLKTLRDEQEHTRLYLRRMRECGVGFGEFPVSGFFWRCVAPMESPLDFVAGLSLTFEQANLDFARHFARGFAAAGDAATAQLLDRIYRDEIGHVAHGLKWLRRWKQPGASDWAAFCRQLKFPLTPQRAKGFALNVEGRRAAGFDEEFIAELNVHAQSKGRTPVVFLFNPLAEGFIARGKSFTPAKHQAALARDLANLPQFLCRQDDLVLVPRRPSVEFLSGLRSAGFALPEFVEWNASSPPPCPAAGVRNVAGRPPHPVPLPLGGGEGARRAGEGGGSVKGISALAGRKLGGLRPWAWGPDSVELLGPLFPQVTGEPRGAEGWFNERIARLYSKAWSAALLDRCLAQVPAEPWLCSRDEVGVAVDSLDDALRAIAAIRARGHHKIVVKEALGLAGGNALRLWEPALLDTQRRWMEGALRHGPLVVEPWLERAADFSAQLEMTPRGLKLCGYTGLINDRSGRFLANWAAPDHARRIPAQITSLLSGPPDLAPRLHRFYAEIFALLEDELRRADFLGPLGIDAFVYRTAQGDCRLKPIVEINPRYTMGRLTVELMRHVAPGSSGLFRLVTRAAARAEGGEDFPAFARALARRHPLRLEGEPIPRIREGALCLNDPAQAQVCLAVFQVGRDYDAVPQAWSRG